MNTYPLPQDKEMTLIEHLSELRSRLLKSLVALAVCTLLCWGFIDSIIGFLTAPASNLYYMRPAEAFFIYLKVALQPGCCWRRRCFFTSCGPF